MLAHAVLAVLRGRGEKNSPWRRASQRTRSAPSAPPSAVARKTQPATRPRLVQLASGPPTHGHLLPLPKTPIPPACLLPAALICSLSTTVVLGSRCGRYACRGFQR